MCAQLVAMEVVVWQSSVYLPARLASSWLLVEAPVLSLCWLLALLALTLSVCARLAMWGCRWARKAEVWKCSSEDEERKDMQQAQNMSCSQAKRRRAATSHQASSRMLSSKKRKPKWNANGSAPSVEGGGFRLPLLEEDVQPVAAQALRMGEPPRASAPPAQVVERAEQSASRNGSNSAKDVGQSQARDGLHGRGKDRLGSEPLTRGRKGLKAWGRVDKEAVRLLGASKLTFGGVVAWTPRPSLEKMLRKETSRATSHGGQERVVPREVPGESGEKGDLEKGRPGGSFRAALEIAKDKVLMATAMDALKKDFWLQP